MTVVAYFPFSGYKSQNKQDMPRSDCWRSSLIRTSVISNNHSGSSVSSWLLMEPTQGKHWSNCFWRISLIRSTLFAFLTNILRVPALKKTTFCLRTEIHILVNLWYTLTYILNTSLNHPINWKLKKKMLKKSIIQMFIWLKIWAYPQKISILHSLNYRDFPTFLKSGPGVCSIWEKSFWTIKVGINWCRLKEMDSNLNWLKTMDTRWCINCHSWKQENLNKNGMKTGFHSHFYTNIHASVTLLFLFRFSCNYPKNVELTNWKWYTQFEEVFC